MPVLDFKLTLCERPFGSFTSRRVLGWFTFEAPDIEAAISFARERYGPIIDVIDCAVLRPTADDDASEVFLKGKGSTQV